MEITEGKIGPEGKYALEYVEGKMKIELGYVGSQAEAGMYAIVSVLDMIQALVDSTETQWDDTLVEPLIKALKPAE